MQNSEGCNSINKQPFSSIYTISEKKLGEGGQGEVYEGYKKDNEQQKLCVKKIKKNQQYGAYNLSKHAEQEFLISAALTKTKHQNIVQTIDLFNDVNEPEAYIVQELCDSNLKTYLDKKETKRFTNLEVYDFLQQIIEGYTFLEKQNIIHRDIKPENILVKSYKSIPTYKVADYGFSCQRESNVTKAQVGTFYYQAPEIIDNQSYGNKCDVFSLGIVLFELYTGNDAKLINKKLLQNKKFSEAYPQLFQDVNKVQINLIDKMTQYKPENRISWQELKQLMNYTINKDQKFKTEKGVFIYNAIRHLDNEKVCVKMLETKYFDEKQLLATQFENEYQINDKLKLIEHKNLVKVYDVKKDNFDAYIYMELCDCTFKEIQDEKYEKFTVQEILDFMSQICSGYLVLIENNIIHRDIKPDNILVVKQTNQQNIYKISDFGVGKQIDDVDWATTKTGTDLYRAPEVGNAEKYNYKCDIYSLGITVAQCYMKFQFQTLMEVQEFEKQLNKTIFSKYFPQLNQIIPTQILQLLDQMIIPDPNFRISWENLNEKVTAIINELKNKPQIQPQLQPQQQITRFQTVNPASIQPNTPAIVNNSVIFGCKSPQQSSFTKQNSLPTYYQQPQTKIQTPQLIQNCISPQNSPQITPNIQNQPLINQNTQAQTFPQHQFGNQFMQYGTPESFTPNFQKHLPNAYKAPNQQPKFQPQTQNQPIQFNNVQNQISQNQLSNNGINQFNNNKLSNNITTDPQQNLVHFQNNYQPQKYSNVQIQPNGNFKLFGNTSPGLNRGNF